MIMRLKSILREFWNSFGEAAASITLLVAVRKVQLFLEEAHCFGDAFIKTIPKFYTHHHQSSLC